MIEFVDILRYSQEEYIIYLLIIVRFRRRVDIFINFKLKYAYILFIYVSSIIIYIVLLKLFQNLPILRVRFYLYLVRMHTNLDKYYKIVTTIIKILSVEL